MIKAEENNATELPKIFTLESSTIDLCIWSLKIIIPHFFQLNDAQGNKDAFEDSGNIKIKLKFHQMGW